MLETLLNGLSSIDSFYINITIEIFFGVVSLWFIYIVAKGYILTRKKRRISYFVEDLIYSGEIDELFSIVQSKEGVWSDLWREFLNWSDLSWDVIEIRIKRITDELVIKYKLYRDNFIYLSVIVLGVGGIIAVTKLYSGKSHREALLLYLAFTVVSLVFLLFSWIINKLCSRLLSIALEEVTAIRSIYQSYKTKRSL